MLLCPLCGDEFPPLALFCPNDKTPRPELKDEDEREEMVIEPTHVKIQALADRNGKKSFQVEPGAVIGEYVLEEKIGEGGMGEVWRGSQPLIGKQVAVKILRRKVAEDKEAIGRFIQEAKVVNSIKHKGLIDIFSFGDLPDKRPYFVMEFLEGKSLSSYLAENGPLPWSEMLDILSQTCGALGATHQHGIIHRDLKSENLFLLFEDGKPSAVKLLDFGIAKLVSPDEENAVLTQAGDIFGTPAYMSPEQCQGTVTQQSDIYSLGIIWYEMITGRTPFYEPGEKVASVLVRQMSELALPPSTLVSGREVPSEIDDLVLQILSKEPQERPASCGELAKELRALLEPLAAKEAPLPKEAKPIYLPTIKGRRQQPVQKKSSAVWLLAVFSLLLSGGLVFYILNSAPAVGAPAMTALPTIPTAPSPITQEAPKSEPQEAKKIQITINSTPTKAQVYLDTKLLGNTPLVQEFDYSETPVELILKKDGYANKPIQIVPNEKSKTTEILEKARNNDKKDPKDKDPKDKDPNDKKDPKEKDPEPKEKDPSNMDPDAIANPFGNKKK